MSHNFGEYGVFLPDVTWELTATHLHRHARKRTVSYQLSDIEGVSFFYGRVQKGPLRYYCRFRTSGGWSGKQMFSVAKADVEKGEGDPYIHFALRLVEMVRASNPASQLQYGQTPAASATLIGAAAISLSLPVILQLGIGDSRATAAFSAIIIPLAGVLVWGAIKHRLRTLHPGETVPPGVFPGPVQSLKNN